MTIFLRPLARFSRTRSRNRALPSPSVIRPSMSITVTSPTSRRAALKLIGKPFRVILPCTAIHKRMRCCSAGVLALVALGHDHYGATGCAGENIHFVHERFHQEHTAAGMAQDVFI